jgi:hypothetical protein
MAKVSDNLKQLWDSLTDAERKGVRKRIHRHQQACWRDGLPVENFDRVFIEAIEVERVEAKEPQGPRPEPGTALEV